MARGVFWLVGNELLAFPFSEDAAYGVAKSGKTYNHEKLWEHIKPKGCSKRFDHYPRGRVEYTGKGNPVIYMNPNISPDLIPEIMEKFGLAEYPTVKYDHSRHYRCFLDEGYENV